jgi:hypothetical protein
MLIPQGIYVIAGGIAPGSISEIKPTLQWSHFAACATLTWSEIFAGIIPGALPPAMTLVAFSDLREFLNSF